MVKLFKIVGENITGIKEKVIEKIIKKKNGDLDNEESNKAIIKSNLLYSLVCGDTVYNDFHIHVCFYDKTGDRITSIRQRY